MSSKDLAVSVRGLSKSYVIAHNTNRPTDLREAIVDRFRHPFGKRGPDHELFWAIKNMDFDIRSGEVVGIIGRNGAGKSTLLKILSRITWPTTGEIDIHGRVSSLLEVGTGFHPELTGRENVFLNGSILGMSRREIKQKFDEIVDFAGVEKFLDTPVKRYSSGMYVRLAFAVAANLDPEILIVDEVLAVGDAAVPAEVPGEDAGCLSSVGSNDPLRQPQYECNFTVMRTCHPLAPGPGGDGRPAGRGHEELRGRTRDGKHRGRCGTTRTGIPPIHRLSSRSTLCDIAGNPTAVFDPGETVQLKLSLKLNRRIVNPILGVRCITGEANVSSPWRPI